MAVMAIATVIATATAMVAVIIKKKVLLRGMLHGPCISLAAKQETKLIQNS